MKIIEELRAAHAAANKKLPQDPEKARASNEDLEGKSPPFTMYEATYTYTKDSVLAAGAVRTIQVTRFDVLPGASKPSISFIDYDGREACGAASLFYMTAEAAQAEVDYSMAFVAKKRAEYDLITLMKNNFLALLECVEALQTIRQQADAALNSDGQVFLSEADIAVLAENALAKLKGELK